MYLNFSHINLIPSESILTSIIPLSNLGLFGTKNKSANIIKCTTK